MESHSMSPGVDPVPSPSPTYPWRPTSSFLDPLGMPLINPSYPSEPERPCPVDTSSPGGSREDTGSENHDHCTLSSSDPSKLPTRQPNEQSTTPRVLYETPDGLRNIQELEKGICRVFLQVLTDPLESTGPCSPQDSNESRKKSSTDGLGPTSPPGGGAGNKHSSLGFGKDLRPGNGNASNTRRSEDEEDNDDDDKHNSNDRDQDNTQQSDQQLFECPFRKRNSEKFDCATHKSCVHQFRDLTKVKDHVRKCHRRRKDTRGNDPGDGITEEMAEKLTGRKRHDKVNTWVKLWRLLFPDDDIPSPDYQTCDQVQQEKQSRITQSRKAGINKRLSQRKAEEIQKGSWSTEKENLMKAVWGDIMEELDAPQGSISLVRFLPFSGRQAKRHPKRRVAADTPMSRLAMRPILPKLAPATTPIPLTYETSLATTQQADYNTVAGPSTSHQPMAGHLGYYVPDSGFSQFAGPDETVSGYPVDSGNFSLGQEDGTTMSQYALTPLEAPQNQYAYPVWDEEPSKPKHT